MIACTECTTPLLAAGEFINADVAYQIAKDLLKNPNPYFQVVMSDNYSDDDTVLRLLTIHDEKIDREKDADTWLL